MRDDDETRDLSVAVVVAVVVDARPRLAALGTHTATKYETARAARLPIEASTQMEKELWSLRKGWRRKIGVD